MGAPRAPSGPAGAAVGTAGRADGIGADRNASGMAQLEADIAAMGAPQITDEESSEIEEFAKTTDGVNIRAKRG